MPRNTSVVLGEHFEGFISNKIEQGRFESKSEAVRAGMRLLEEHENKVDALNRALIEGEKSGDAGPQDMAVIRQKTSRSERINMFKIHKSRKVESDLI